MRAGNRIYLCLKEVFDGRVWPKVKPSSQSNDNRAYAVYQRISGTPENTVDGYAEINQCRYQITVYDQDYDNAFTLGESAKRVIDHDVLLSALIGVDEMDQDAETNLWFMRFDATVWEQLHIGA